MRGSNVPVTRTPDAHWRAEVRYRGTIGRRSDFKKAVVTLAEGNKIDVTTGI